MAIVSRFRHDLAEALPLWLSEELVTPEQADRLRAYYRLAELPAAHRGRFAGALLTTGALLVGLGVIAFVAANWGLISPGVRAVGAIVLMVALQVWGFRLWQQPSRQRHGSALLALGGFLFGGNLVLMAQWFQIEGSTSGLFLAWAAGCLVMGAALTHGVLVTMGAGLLLLALTTGAPFAWLFPWAFLGVLGLASLTRSRAAWLVAALALVGSASFLVLPLGPVIVTMTLLALHAGLWGASELAGARWPWRALVDRLAGDRPDDAGAPAEVARPWVVVSLLGLLHSWAFAGTWALVPALEPVGTPAVVSVGLLAALGVAAWVLAWKRAADPVLHRAVGFASLGLYGLLQLASVGGGHHLAANGLLLALQLVLAWRGLMRGERLWFWLGFGSLGWQVVVRFLEFDTGLLLKSAAFILWGLALMGVGLWFERQMARQARVG